MSSDLLNRNTMPANAETLDNGQADPDGQETDYRTANDRPQATFYGSLVPPRGPADVIAPTLLEINPPDGTFLGIIDSALLAGGGAFAVSLLTDEPLRNFSTLANWQVTREDGAAHTLSVRSVTDVGVNAEGNRLYQLDLEGSVSEGKYTIEVNPDTSPESHLPVTDDAGNVMANTAWDYYVDLIRPSITRVNPTVGVPLDLSSGFFASPRFAIWFSEYIGTNPDEPSPAADPNEWTLTYEFQDGTTIVSNAVNVMENLTPFQFNEYAGFTGVEVQFPQLMLPTGTVIVKVTLTLLNRLGLIKDRAQNSMLSSTVSFEYSVTLPDLVVPTWVLDDDAIAACELPLAIDAGNNEAAFRTTLPPIDVQFSEEMVGAGTAENYIFLGVDDLEGNPAYQVVSVQDLGNNKYRIIAEAVGTATTSASSYTGTVSLSTSGITDTASNALSATIDWTLEVDFPTNMSLSPAEIGSTWNGDFTVDFNQAIMEIGDGIEGLWYLTKVVNGSPTGTKVYPTTVEQQIQGDSGEYTAHVLSFDVALAQSTFGTDWPQSVELRNGGGFIYAKNSCGQAGMPFSASTYNYEHPRFGLGVADDIRPHLVALNFIDAETELCRDDANSDVTFAAEVWFNEPVNHATNKDNWHFYITNGNAIYHLNRDGIDAPKSAGGFSDNVELTIDSISISQEEVETSLGESSSVDGDGSRYEIRATVKKYGSGAWPVETDQWDRLIIMPNRVDIMPTSGTWTGKAPVQPIADDYGNLVVGDNKQLRSATSFPKNDDGTNPLMIGLIECVGDETAPTITSITWDSDQDDNICNSEPFTMKIQWSEIVSGHRAGMWIIEVVDANGDLVNGPSIRSGFSGHPALSGTIPQDSGDITELTIGSSFQSYVTNQAAQFGYSGNIFDGTHSLRLHHNRNNTVEDAAGNTAPEEYVTSQKLPRCGLNSWRLIRAEAEDTWCNKADGYIDITVQWDFAVSPGGHGVYTEANHRNQFKFVHNHTNTDLLADGLVTLTPETVDGNLITYRLQKTPEAVGLTEFYFDLRYNQGDPQHDYTFGPTASNTLQDSQGVAVYSDGTLDLDITEGWLRDPCEETRLKVELLDGGKDLLVCADIGLLGYLRVRFVSQYNGQVPPTGDVGDLEDFINPSNWYFHPDGYNGDPGDLEVLAVFPLLDVPQGFMFQVGYPANGQPPRSSGRISLRSTKNFYWSSGDVLLGGLSSPNVLFTARKDCATDNLPSAPDVDILKVTDRASSPARYDINAAAPVVIPFGVLKGGNDFFIEIQYNEAAYVPDYVFMQTEWDASGEHVVLNNNLRDGMFYFTSDNVLEDNGHTKQMFNDKIFSHVGYVGSGKWRIYFDEGSLQDYMAGWEGDYLPLRLHVTKEGLHSGIRAGDDGIINFRFMKG